MNVTDRLGEALLARPDPFECVRCGQPAVVIVIVNGALGNRVSESLLCRACHSDFCWFMVAEIEQPNSSSDSVSGETEVSNG